MRMGSSAYLPRPPSSHGAARPRPLLGWSKYSPIAVVARVSGMVEPWSKLRFDGS